MIYLILLGLTFFIQLLSCIWFVMVETQRGKKSALKFKLLCSLIYIADALLCAAMKNTHTSIYFILIFSGFLISFAGDVISNLREDKNDTVLFITHSLSNVIYLSSYITAIITVFGVKPTRLLFILAILPVGIVLIPFMCKKGGKYRVPLMLSVVSSVLMLGGALYLGILCQNTGIPTMQSVSCVVISGSVAVCLSRLLHTRQQISPPPPLKPQLPKYCMYFFGQMAIACSIIIPQGGL